MTVMLISVKKIVTNFITIVESSSLYFLSPENKLSGEVGWVYPCEDKVSI